MASIKDPNDLLQELDLLNGKILKIDENLTELYKGVVENIQRINEVKFQIETSEELLKELFKKIETSEKLLKELLKKRIDLIEFIEKRYPI